MKFLHCKLMLAHHLRGPAAIAHAGCYSPLYRKHTCPWSTCCYAAPTRPVPWLKP
jgi:hypothetical protein